MEGQSIPVSEIEAVKGSDLPEVTTPENMTFLGYNDTPKNTVRISFENMTPLFGVTQTTGQSLLLAPSQKLFTDTIALKADKTTYILPTGYMLSKIESLTADKYINSSGSEVPLAGQNIGISGKVILPRNIPMLVNNVWIVDASVLCVFNEDNTLSRYLNSTNLINGSMPVTLVNKERYINSAFRIDGESTITVAQDINASKLFQVDWKLPVKLDIPVLYKSVPVANLITGYYVHQADGTNIPISGFSCTPRIKLPSNIPFQIEGYRFTGSSALAIWKKDGSFSRSYASGSPSPLIIVLRDDESEIQSTVQQSTEFKISLIQISSDQLFSLLQFVTPNENRLNYDTVFPKKIYTVTSDVAANVQSQYQLTPKLYLDHLIKDDIDIEFRSTNGKDRINLFPIVSDIGDIYNNGQSVYNKQISASINGKGVYQDKTFSFTQVSTKASVGVNSHVRFMQIGDSNTALVGLHNLPSTVVRGSWERAKQLFDIDAIQSGQSDKYKCTLIGQAQKATVSYEFKGTSYNLKQGAEGYGGWTTSDILQSSQRRFMSKGLWDSLGLKTQAGHDYTGSAADKLLICQTPEGKYNPDNTTDYINYIKSYYDSSVTDFASAVTAQTYRQNNPVNPFYLLSKAQSSTTAFSFSAYLNRYRTMDAIGNRLDNSSSSKGTLVTDTSAFNVGEPTHIVLQFGHNDLGLITKDAFIWALQALKNEVKAALPSAFIGLAFYDIPGTFFPELYPEWSDAIRGQRDNYFTSLSDIMAMEDTANKVYYVPTWFIQPTAYGLSYKQADSPESLAGDLNEFKSFMRQGAPGSGTALHPGLFTHSAWGYELYSWIKYTLSIG